MLNSYRFKSSFLFWFILLTINSLFLFTLHSSAATQVSLEWVSNSEQNLAGYRMFCREQGQPYDYANPSWEGTDTTCTIFNLDETKTWCFVARAFDTQGFESEDSAEVCQDPVAATNRPPVADAGPDQIVDEEQTILLNGSNSTDSDDGIASYHWVQIDGPPINLSDPDARQPTFTAPDTGPEGVALTFELTAADYNGLRSTDSCVVNVTWMNEPPQANAGPDQTVSGINVVALDGSGSLDIDDGIAGYSWKQTSGPAVILMNPASSSPVFSAPGAGPDGVSLTFDLTVTDAGGLMGSDSCIVNITWQNQPPTATLTPDYTETTEGESVVLDGSASMDSDDSIAEYRWTQVEGDPVSLSDSRSAVTTFTAPRTDTHGRNNKFKLTVTDRSGLQSAADKFIYVMPP